MKVTVVVEFNVPDDTPASGVEGIVSDCLSDRLPAEFGFRIMEAIAAPYGPEPGEVCVMIPKAHGPVSERFMRHHYGPSGYVKPK